MPSHISSLDQDVIRHARVIPLDIVQAKGNGHAGTAVSLTPALYVLFQEFLRHAPRDPKWLGRDRFVLACGHASLALRSEERTSEVQSRGPVVCRRRRV